MERENEQELAKAEKRDVGVSIYEVARMDEQVLSLMPKQT